ncbi:uncharacterized protein EV420DRAFT_970845 [Desarmillaria tabescens]|uniref:Heterokaryon incompatibility domain-containing protein n=1 Tax=Armillaria tabescens TaxID=1929756 RepID=A0AA39JM48_ARMTA|nr:uncharacterized protein EV420DRAFT_970845 [Desarmillaria tabescens]KAK0445296.1 hypothetical protein EV420DRAFT_970845 [Desarmillaria tabescens]
MQMRKYDPPEVTLSALAEASQDESTIPVLKQQSYTGKKVIPSALADTPCADLGVNGVFEKLNTILGTSYILSPMMSSVLDSYIREKWDFGRVYAYLRFYWFGFASIEKSLRRDEEGDRRMRRRMITDDRITRREVSPRRLWDLHANRVVPYWIALAVDWVGISHAWVSDEERMNVMTPINGYEWPVPMPKDANLNLIRVEMLNFGAEYAWLDVLCLRQEYAIREDHREEDQRKEDQRKEEWKLDVPTIGYVYRGRTFRYENLEIGDSEHKVICYLSGLGRPLNLKLGYFESDRCWFNRAWTLQEVPFAQEPLIAGDTGDDRFVEEEIQTRVHQQLNTLAMMQSWNISYSILSQMRNRVSTKPLDKVAGLVYLFRTNFIPTYDAAQSEEDVWAALVNAMQSTVRAGLFFHYPEPGNRSKSWRPSWEQVMAPTLPQTLGWFDIGDVHSTEMIDWYAGPRIDSVYVCGLADPSNNPRQGKLSIKDNAGESCACKIVAKHTYPIPDGGYIIIGTKRPWVASGNIWVVGRLRQDGKFEKVSVIHLADSEVEKLQELRVEKKVTTILC